MFLLRHGHVYDERNAAGQRKGRWTRDFWAWVGRIDLGDASAMATLDHYCECVRRADAEKAALEAKLEASEKKNEELKNQLLRTAAEYDNYRKRSQREADQKFNDGVSHAVTQILGILDTLDMAANAVCADENYKKGVMMTLDKAAKALENLNITEIEALNKPFDPNFMNAVQQVPPAEGQESGDVVQVFQKGYKIGDKIIRHATVVVAE